MQLRPSTKPVILGLAGTALQDVERRFFEDADPLGFILFQRNCETPDQVKALCTALRETVSRPDAPILIDQEGGRVQRLRAPNWQETPPAREIGKIAEADLQKGKRAAYLHAQLIGIQLRDAGITVNCAPCLDLIIDGAHEIIGDRSYGGDPTLVRTLGAEACAGYLSLGITPVIKHLPGHGRAAVDSHHDLPVIDTGLDTLQETDFAAFKDQPGQAWGMTGHLMIPALDPDNCITLSRAGIDSVIRKQIGFDGVLLSDDLSMKALSGTLGDRTTGALAAGCDIALHCNGDMDEMRDVVEHCSSPSGDAIRRLSSNVPGQPDAMPDLGAAAAELSDLLKSD
ncbi:MAG: beta-N-acetylhexosaminidase [Alphaproteobacteria bacterium]